MKPRNDTGVLTETDRSGSHAVAGAQARHHNGVGGFSVLDIASRAIKVAPRRYMSKHCYKSGKMGELLLVLPKQGAVVFRDALLQIQPGVDLLASTVFADGLQEVFPVALLLKWKHCMFVDGEIPARFLHAVRLGRAISCHGQSGDQRVKNGERKDLHIDGLKWCLGYDLRECLTGYVVGWNDPKM